MRTFRLSAIVAVVLASLVCIPILDACSRVTWIGPKGLVVTGRSMDWPYGFNSHFYIFPQGTLHSGSGGKNSLTWTAKYGTVVVAGTTDPQGPIDGVFDGMNEKGLAANLLYLAETDFGPAPESDKPRVSFAGWTLYVLSQFATVDDVVNAFQGDPLYIVPINFGPGKKAHPTVHLSISDPTGNSAIIEYIKGKPIIHHGREYQVMTNSPTYDQQLTLNNYWKRLDGTKMLPGSHQSEDRFVRASYYLSHLPETNDARQAVSGVFSVMRNVSVPWGQPDEQHPNIAPTYWRTVIDQTNRRYYFESTLSPNIVWADLSQIDFSPGTGIRSLRVETNDEIIGNVNKAFKESKNIVLLSP